MNQNIRLCDLPLHTSGVIVSIGHAQRLSRRLMDMGILEGARVTAAFRSISGDPMAFWVNNTLLALRLSDCEQITVTPLSEAAYA